MEKGPLILLLIVMTPPALDIAYGLFVEHSTTPLAFCFMLMPIVIVVYLCKGCAETGRAEKLTEESGVYGIIQSGEGGETHER